MSMTKLYFFVLTILLASCNNNSKNNNVAQKASVIDFSFFDSKIDIDSTVIKNLKNEELKSFYINRNYKTAWDVKEHRAFAITEIANAENEGLEPKDYDYFKLKNYEENHSNLNDSLSIEYDLLLTESFQRYITHISKGKINPNVFYDNCDLSNKKVEVNTILNDCIDNNNFSTAIENCKPSHDIYKKLKTSLALLRQFPDDNDIGIVDLKLRILPNKKYKVIPTIKKRLMFWGDMTKNDTILDNVYDKDTQEAVKIFQKRHGLFPDGVIGRSTIDAINYTKSQRIEQVIANMERWRWFQHDFGDHYLLINIPDYKVVVIKDGDTIQKQRVVVGKESRKTPMLESKISNINLNPNWTVPPTILKEDVFPEAEKSRAAFIKRDLKILNSKNQEVSPWQWKMEDAKKYKYVQDPGYNNSLGLMKINFPNKFSVYLHDTNHRDYFTYSFRSLSSGCVRLEKPLEMAEHILNDPEKWSLQKIKDTTDIKYYKKLQKEKEKEYNKKIAKLLAKNPELEIKKKEFPEPELKTIMIKVTDEILIHQLYWTAWEENGVLQFREDIYCYDHDIYAKLRYKNYYIYKK